eukprot:COSAG01_NODE_3237_length_6370_cov_4.236007_1_plen_197_part_10
MPTIHSRSKVRGRRLTAAHPQSCMSSLASAAEQPRLPARFLSPVPVAHLSPRVLCCGVCGWLAGWLGGHAALALIQEDPAVDERAERRRAAAELRQVLRLGRAAGGGGGGGGGGVAGGGSRSGGASPTPTLSALPRGGSGSGPAESASAGRGTQQAQHSHGIRLARSSIRVEARGSEAIDRTQFLQFLRRQLRRRR